MRTNTLCMLTVILIALCVRPAGAAPRKKRQKKPVEPFARSESDWKHYQAFVTEKPPWVKQRWARLSGKQREMIEDGMLDVTIYDGWQGNAVDPTGKRDSTKALNHAVAVGRDYDLVAYFPGGTYLVSGMLNCMNRTYIRYSKRKTKPVLQGSRRHTCKLYGDRKSRAVIRLKDGAPGFGDPADPQCVVAMWKPKMPDNKTDYRNGHPAAHYYATIDGITIDCGRNPGAIGLFYKGAQGSMVAGVHVDATHAYAGLEGGTWAVGGVFGLTVQGGRYGILIHGNPAHYVGLTLLDQTSAALKFDGGAGPVTVTGFRIRRKRGPIVTLRNDGVFASSVHGNLLLMDGTIELADGGTAIDNAAGKNLYMENVYVRGAQAIVKSGADAPLAGANDGWTQVVKYAYCDRTAKAKDGKFGKLVCPSDSLINGRVTKQHSPKLRKAAAPPADLITRHLWGDIPQYGDGDPAIKNAVRELGLDNTGRTSVRAALQAAIDKHEKILLPKGQYLLDGTITLRAHTKLFGISPCNVEFLTAESWKPAKETPIITTDNAPDGTAMLGNILIVYRTSPAGTYHFNALTWRVGRRSVLRYVVGKSADYLDVKTTEGYPVSTFRVRDGGGGRWYSCVHGHKKETNHPDYRILTIENTTEPLTFYNYGGIHSRSTADQALIRNAQNVRFISYNLEPPGHNNVYHAIHSRNLAFYGFGNSAVPHEGLALVRLTDCENVRCAMFSQGKHLRADNTDAYQVLEVRNGQERGITGDRILCLYERGEFRFPVD